MVFSQRRELGEHPCCLPHDQSHKAQRDTEIEEVQGDTIGGDMLTREYHLEEIQPVSKDQKYGHKSYRCIVTLGRPGHEDQKRAYKVDYEVQIKDTSVWSVEPGLEVNGLFGDVGVPDQHELVEPQITPEDGKSELEFTQVMKVFLVDIFQVALVFEVDDEDRDQRYAGDEGAGERVPAIHRGEPVCVDAHEPQPGRHGSDGEREPYDEERCPYRVLKDIFPPFFDAQGGVVDATGELTHFITQQGPKADGECRPDGKETRAKEPAFAFERFIMRHQIPVEPLVNSIVAAKYQAHQDHEGDDANGDHGSGDGFGDAAEGQYETAHRQGDRAKEEHGRIGNEQEVDTILQEGRPEPGAMVMTAIEDESNNQRDHAHRHQSQGPLLISAGYYEMFFNG